MCVCVRAQQTKREKDCRAIESAYVCFWLNAADISQTWENPKLYTQMSRLSWTWGPQTQPPHTRGSRQKHTQVKPLAFIHTATDTPSEKHWWKDHETGLTRLIHAYKTPLHKHKGLFQSLIQGKRIEHDHMRFENKRGQLRFFFQPFSCYRCHCHGTPLHTDTGPCAQIFDCRPLHICGDTIMDTQPHPDTEKLVQGHQSDTYVCLVI